jgi:O-antigen/teichoic acid export membrane protein
MVLPRMADLAGMERPGPATRLRALMAARRGLVMDYLAAVSGSAGRLVFSLIYFLALANALSLAEFGLFATASAAGVMLARLLAFGFMSALYRTATKRPRLIGTFTAGFLLFSLASLPLIGLAAAFTYWLFFGDQMPVAAFALIIAAEALLARPMEAVIIVNNGMGRFGRGSLMTIMGVALRTGAAALFYFSATRTLDVWAWYYLAANAIALLVAVVFFHPRQRLRLEPKLYWRRLPDSLSVAGSEVLFYLQMEFDKLLVLALGGAHLAGIYAVVMRLVDLTAIPIRTFNMMLVQKMMRTPEFLARLKTKVGFEAGVFVISTMGILCLATILHFYPTLLGKNVAEAAPLLMLALFIPGLRNLVEYHAELLYARGQTFVRTINLAILAAAKGGLLTLLLTNVSEPGTLVWWLNAAFAALYLVSLVLTYRALAKPARRI